MYGSPPHRLVTSLTYHFGNQWPAEEIVHDALIRARDRWDSVGSLVSAVGWNFRVGVNLGDSWFRRRFAERRARLRHSVDATVHHDGDAADRLTVARVLASLTHRQREVVVLRYLLGLSADEAADVLGSTAGAVRGATDRALVARREDIDVHLEISEGTDVS